MKVPPRIREPGSEASETAKPTAADRWLALARATVSVIAERGLEGLRTRDAAARVGVNIATLHYYFATKEDLIAEAVAYLVALDAAAFEAACGEIERWLLAVLPTE